MGFRFETLEIWKLAREFATHIYAITARFPSHEKYGLADQMNQAINSISFNIADRLGQDTNTQFDRYIGYSVWLPSCSL